MYYEFKNKIATQKMILLYLGGPLTNILSATLLWIFGNSEWADMYRGYIIFSYLTGIVNLVPFKFKSGMESDGLQILNLMSGRDNNERSTEFK